MCSENGFEGDRSDAVRALSIVFTTLGRQCLTPRGNVAAYTWKNIRQIWNQLYSTSQPQTIVALLVSLISPQDIDKMRYVFNNSLYYIILTCLF